LIGKRLRKRFPSSEGGEAITTMRDVAEHAGVSVTTVSHVINDTRHVSEELRTRVEEAMRELAYQPNALARSLRRNESCTIGMILPDGTNPYFAEIARSIEDKSFSEDYSVIICNSDGDLSKELNYINVLMEKRVDGIIFVAAGMSAAHIRMLQEKRMPVVVVDRDSPGVMVDSVQIDNAAGGQLATDHLVELGHERIACIAGPSYVTPSGERVDGYRRALHEAGLSADADDVLLGNFNAESGYQAATQLLSRSDPPTAIFACNDLMAIGAISAARAMGFRMPRDISIVGFDDIQLAHYSNPPLTTVRQPKYEMGRLATNLLLERIQDPDMQPRARVLDTQLVVRASSSAPRTERQ
jgi:LacI family transcriptional regulator